MLQNVNKLLKNLMSQIPVVDYYPTKHPKKQKEVLKYRHESTKEFKRVNPNTQKEETFLVGVTYYKEQ